MRQRFFRSILALFMVVALASCAALFSGPPPVSQKRCAETPQNAVLIFLRGIAEFSLRLIKAVLPEGISVFVVFGGGDEARGREVASQLFRHPEVVPAGSSVGMIPSLADMEYLGGNEWWVKIEREDTLASEGSDAEEMIKIYQRRFLARFDPDGNCIIRVQPLDPTWQRVR